jgi:hypothetical protein
MLNAVRKKRSRWWVPSLDFVIEDAAHRLVGEVTVGICAWGPPDVIIVDGVEHRISMRWGGLRQPLILMLEQGGLVLAKARRRSDFFGRDYVTYTIEHAAKQYALRLVMGRGWVLYDGERVLGTLHVSSTNEEARLDLPEYLPILLRLFVLWLVISYAAED